MANEPGARERVSTARRFWEKVDKRGPDECWVWCAGCDHVGYGKFWYEGATRLAHHVACEFHGIPVPGYPKSENVIDHICKNRACVNPAHLRIVTQAENCGPLAKPTPHWQNKNKTHCHRGHEFTPENTYRINPDGHRNCKACRKITDAARRERA